MKILICISASILCACIAAAAEPVTFTPGAPQIASGNVVLDSALDPSGGKIASSASFTLKPGFVGQLYEVVALSVAASPASVAEGAATQLAATGTLDDNTTLAIAAGSVAWSVQSGPLLSISAGGLATAAPVFGDTAAVARGVGSGFIADTPLTVLDTLHDNFGPVAGDGIDDAWQFAFFDADNNETLDPSEAALAAPGADPDGDDSSNFIEWAGGFDPLSVSSQLRFRIVSVAGGVARFLISATRAGTTYAVQRSDSLDAAALKVDVAGFEAITDEVGVPLEDAGAVQPKAFYRLRLEREP